MDIQTDSTKESAALASGAKYSMASLDSFVDPAALFPDKVDRSVYDRELSLIRRDLPFSLAYGRVNPYCNQQILSPLDYDFYCHCLALRRICDRQLLAASNAVRAAQRSADAAEREAEHYKQGLAACEQKLAQYEDTVLALHGKVQTAQSAYNALQARIQRRRTRLAQFFLFVCFAGLLSFLIVSCSRPAEKASVAPVVPASSSSSHSEPVSDGPDRPEGYVSNYYVGNKKSHKFHRTTCSYLPDEENRRKFKSREAAVSAGYEPCGHCNP